MKKLLAVVLFAVMTLSALALCVSADSISMGGGTPTGVTATVKKTTGVTIDGVISAGEYERLDIDTDEDSTILHMCYGTADVLDKAEAMLKTMEYYASWSDGKINIAVRNKPEVIIQTLNVKTDGNPEDNFCHQVAYTISSDHIQTRAKGAVCNFYYAVAKRTDNGQYLLGYYGSEQWGNSKSYRPTAGVDFAIGYGADGYATLEWSIPFAEITESGTAGVGDTVYLSIGAEAGEGDESMEATGVGQTYCVSLGDFTYLVGQKVAKNHAAFQLLGETIDAGTTPGTTDPGEGTQPVDPSDPTQPVDPEDPTQPVDPDDPTQPVDPEDPTQPVDPEDPTQPGEQNDPKTTDPENQDDGNGNDNPTPTQPAKTGDPMIVMAAVAAVSAAGAFIIGKKRSK